MKFAKDQGFCTTLSYVAFTDSESVIGDAMRVQNTAFDASRLFADPDDGASASHSVLLLLTGSEHLIGDALPEFTVFTSAEVTDLIAGVEIFANDMGNRTTLSLSPSRKPTEFGLVSIS